MSMEQIRSMYGVPACRGTIVCVEGTPSFVGKWGVIKSARNSRLRVLLDGESRARSFHPLDLAFYPVIKDRAVKVLPHRYLVSRKAV